MVKEWLEKSEVWILDSDLKGLKMADYIPCTDSAFQMWANNFMDHANDHLADLGLTAVDLAGLSNMQADYMLRWVKKWGRKGPWSETIIATITA